MGREVKLPNIGGMLGALTHDAAVGANLAFTMLPKAMAYAVVAGVPPAYGLYASCAAPALAVTFGNNRLLFTGPVGVMTVLVLGSLHHFAHPFTAAYIALAATLTLMVAILTLLFAAARLGFLIRAIPTPVTEGFILAAALLIIGTQVGPALGAPPLSERSGIHLPRFLADAAEAWSRGDVLVPALFSACIASALLARRHVPRIPDAFFVIVLAVAAVFAFGLQERGVEMVGALPTGLPPLSLPTLAPLLSTDMWASAALLALVGMTETSSIARFVGRKTGQRSDPGREAIGQGTANLAVAFVGGYPVCATLSGTSVNLAGGARGPRPIYFFTALALIVVLGLGPLFAYLPRFALAAVVTMAVASLLDPRRFVELCRADKLDALVALTTFCVTLLVGPEPGILSGVAAVENTATAGDGASMAVSWRTRRRRPPLPGAASQQLFAVSPRRGDLRGDAQACHGTRTACGARPLGLALYRRRWGGGPPQHRDQLRCSWTARRVCRGRERRVAEDEDSRDACSGPRVPYRGRGLRARDRDEENQYMMIRLVAEHRAMVVEAVRIAEGRGRIRRDGECAQVALCRRATSDI
jgi:MFS superfamily sulfate permease-like transporter